MLTSTREVPSADLNCADERLSMEEVDSIITFTKADDDACDCEPDMLHGTMAYVYTHTLLTQHRQVISIVSISLNCVHQSYCPKMNQTVSQLFLSLLFAKKNIKMFIYGCD